MRANLLINTNEKHELANWLKIIRLVKTIGYNL